MHLVTLSEEARSLLAGQLPEVLPCAFISAFPLVRISDNTVVDTVQVMLRSDQADVSVAVTLFGHTSFTAVARRSATPSRIAQLIQDHSNAGDFGHEPGEKVALVVKSDLDTVLQVAISQVHGAFLLPVELSDLLLVVTPSGRPAKRAIFSFMLAGRVLTMPVLLPSSYEVALHLLRGCVKKIVDETPSQEVSQ